MQLTCQQDELSHALQVVSRGIATKSSLPILGSILLVAEENKLTLHGTDLEIAIETSLPAEIEKPGKACVSGKTLSEFVKRLMPGQIEMRTKEQSLHVKGGASIILPTMPAEEYPEFPAIQDGVSFVLSASILREVNKQVTAITLNDDSRAFLMSVLWQNVASELSFVATDINRLALRRVPVVADDFKALVPIKTMKEIANVFSPSAEMNVSICPKRIVLAGECVVFSSRLMEAEFPDYNQVFPKDFICEMVINRESLADAIGRAALVGDDAIKFTLLDGVLQIFGEDSAKGQVTENLDAVITGEPFDHIVFSPKYLLDFLKAVISSKVKFSFTKPTDRALLISMDNDDYQYVVMPYQVN